MCMCWVFFSSRRLVESASSGGKTYESFLRQVLEFHNPSNVSNLTSMFDIKDSSTHPSLMRGLFRYAPCYDYAN